MIDTHLHLWRLDAGWYGWNTPDLGAVHADSTLAQVAAPMAASGVQAAVVVQAADSEAETDSLLDLAEREPLLTGVVGYLSLADAGALEVRLGELAGTALVGVRQLWHDQDDPGLLAGAAVVAGLRMLGQAGLVVDVPDAFPHLLPAMIAAVEECPETTFVLDHCGKPPFGDRSAWARWESAFTDLAGRPNVVIKVSGLFGGSGSATPATAAELDHVVALTRTVAGADRAMLGSDWPMTRGHLTYEANIDRLLALVAGWSADEQAAVTAETARRVYRL